MIKVFTPTLVLLKKRWKLVLILAAVLFKGLAWAVVTPPWQTPDEPEHFAYVQYLAVEHKVPSMDTSLSKLLTANIDITERTLSRYSQAENTSLSWSNFYGIIHHPEQRTLFPQSYAIAYNQLLQKNLDTTSTGTTYVSNYPPLYYMLNILPYYLGWHSILDKLLAMRMLSILLELVLVYIVYLSGTLIGNESFGLAAAMIVGFQPELSMIFSSVNNDVLVDLMGCVLFYFLLSFQSVKPSWKAIVIASIAMGIALLGKAEAWPLVGVFWVSLFISWYKSYKDWISSILTLVVTALIYSPWALFSWVHYHTPIGVVYNYNAYTGSYHNFFQFVKYEIAFSRFFSLWVVKFFADFGWSDTMLSMYWYVILDIIGLVTIIGAVIILLSYHKGLKKLKPIIKPIYQCLAFIIPLIIFLYYVEWNCLQIYNSAILEGRYLLPVLSPVIILILLVFDGLTAQRYSKKIFASSAIFMVVFNMASLLTIIYRYYGIIILPNFFRGFEEVGIYVSRCWALEISSTVVLMFLCAFFFITLAFIIYFISSIFLFKRQQLEQ